jgi:hypothetical protein
VCPESCPPKRRSAPRTASSDGCTYCPEIAIELRTATRVSIHASRPDSPSRVRKVRRRLYRTNARKS